VNIKHNVTDEELNYFSYSEEEDLGLYKGQIQNCCRERPVQLLLVSLKNRSFFLTFTDRR